MTENPISTNRDRDAWNYIETMRYEWAHRNDGQSWLGYLEQKMAETREGVNYWSYCTDAGMRKLCPEKVEDLCDFMMSLGIAPYSMRKKT